MNPSAQSAPNNEISLLDILVVLAENFWLLVLGPLVVGAITFAIVSLLPKTYESLAVLAPAELLAQRNQPYEESSSKAFVATITARLHSAELQTSAAEDQPWISRRKMDKIQTRRLLKRAVNISADQKSGLINLTTRAPSASEAQSFTQAIIDKLAVSITPRGAELERLQKNIDSVRKNLEDTISVIKTMTGEGRQTGEISKDKQVSMTSLADLFLQREAFEGKLQTLQLQSKPDVQTIIIQAPSLDERPAAPKLLQLTALAVSLSMLALTVIVFLHAGLRATAEDPQGANKIARIRKGLLRR
jgi:uncharacterized protein involved in exopolysaccharide biosynthesis